MGQGARDDTGERFGLEDLFGECPLFQYADLDLAPFQELPPDLWSESLLRINEGVNLYVDAREVLKTLQETEDRG